jgi:predicted PurR-regulated permease PerM
VNFGQSLGFLSFLLSLYILWQIRQLLLLFFTAVVLATALNRLVLSLQQFGIKKKFAIAATLIIILTVIILVFALIVPPFTEELQKFVELLPKVWERVRFELLKLQERQSQWKWLSFLPLANNPIQQLQPLGTELFKNFFAIFSNSILVVLEILLVLFLALMMLFNPPLYRRSFLKLVPSFYRRRADEILTLSEEILTSWLAGACISSTFVGVASGIGLSILGINLVLVNALLAGLLNFIPNIGPTASIVFPVTIALLDSPWKIGAIFILYFIIQNLESYLITPTIMAQQVSLLPAVTLTAQLFFAQTFGLLGLLLALPLTVVVKTCLEEILLKDILDCWKILPEVASIAVQNSEPTHLQ